MTDPYNDYLAFLRKLEKARADDDEVAEDAILEEMDDLWLELSEDQRSQLDTVVDLAKDWADEA